MEFDLANAKKVDNYEADATGATALWPDTTHYKATCPAGKRWVLIGGVVKRDVSSTLDMYVRSSATEALLQLDIQTAATGYSAYPNYLRSDAKTLIVLDPGDYVEALFGTAQGAGAIASCQVLEFELGA